MAISAKVAATIISLPFPEGSQVTKGKLADGSDASIIVQLDDKDLKAALHSAERGAMAGGEDHGFRGPPQGQRSMIEQSRVNMTDAERDPSDVRKSFSPRKTSASRSLIRPRPSTTA